MLTAKCKVPATNTLAAPAAGQQAWEKQVAVRPNIWKESQELESTSLRSTHHAMVYPLDDGSLFVDGRLPSNDSYVITFKSPVRKLTAVRIESLTDPDRFEQGPVRAPISTRC